MIVETLNRLHYAGWHNDDLARAAGVSPPTMSRIRNERTPAHARDIQALAIYLCKHGEISLAACFLSPEYEIVRRAPGQTDGRIEDDACDMTQALGGLIDSFEGMNPREWESRLREAESALESLRAEGARRFPQTA